MRAVDLEPPAPTPCTFGHYNPDKGCETEGCCRGPKYDPENGVCKKKKETGDTCDKHEECESNPAGPTQQMIERAGLRRDRRRGTCLRLGAPTGQQDEHLLQRLRAL